MQNIIGPIVSKKVEKKKWPTAAIIISVLVTVMLAFIGGFPNVVGLYIAGVYWVLFFIWQWLRFRRRTIYFFGTDGLVRRMEVGKNIKQGFLLYKDIHSPRFDIRDRRLNGIHQHYLFVVNYGVLEFSYKYDNNSAPADNFDYQCSHELFRCWSQYKTGERKDYVESAQIMIGRMNNRMKEYSS